MKTKIVNWILVVVVSFFVSVAGIRVYLQVFPPQVVPIQTGQALGAADLSPWIGLSEEQIARVEDYVTVLSDSFFTNTYGAPMRQLFGRFNEFRYSADYASIYTAWDSGHVYTILPGDTVDMDQIYPYGNPPSYTAIIGSGPSSALRASKVNYSQGFPVLVIEDDSFIVISNLTILHDTTSEYTIEHDGGIYINGNANHILLDRLYIPRCTGDGITMQDNASYETPHDIVISNCIIEGDSVDHPNWALVCSRVGINFVEARRVIVSNNIIRGFPLACIGFESSARPLSYPDDAFQDIVVDGNILTPWNDGVQMNARTGGYNNIVISNNVIDGSDYLNHWGAAGQNKAGIYVVDFYHREKHVSIVGNRIRRTNYGMLIRNTGGHTIVDGNHVSECLGQGIQINGHTHGVVCTNNTVRENGGIGIYLYGYTPYDSASAIMSNHDFETDFGSDWWLDGSTTSADTYATRYTEGSYSWRVVSTDADSGIYQPVTMDTAYVYYIEADCYMEDDSSYSYVDMECKGARWQKVVSIAKESGYDSTWQTLRLLVDPSGTDTLRIRSVRGGCVFLVDNIRAWAAQPMRNVQVKDNIVYNNTTYGMRTTGYVIDSYISGNNIYAGKFYSNSAAHSQTYGIMNDHAWFFTEFLDNNISGSNSYDCYLKAAYRCKLSLIGIEKPYWDVASPKMEDNWFPYAKTLSYYGDVYPNTTHTAFGGTWHMMENGRLLGLSTQTDSVFTAGSITCLPRIGDTALGLSASFNARIDYQASGYESGKIRLFTVHATDYQLEFSLGDRVSVDVAADASVPDTTGFRYTLLYE